MNSLSGCPAYTHVHQEFPMFFRVGLNTSAVVFNSMHDSYLRSAAQNDIVSGLIYDDQLTSKKIFYGS